MLISPEVILFKKKRHWHSPCHRLRTWKRTVWRPVMGCRCWCSGTCTPLPGPRLPAQSKTPLSPGRISTLSALGTFPPASAVCPRTPAGEVPTVRGDCDETLNDPGQEAVAVRRFKTALLRGHRSTPWGDTASAALVQWLFDVDLLVSEHTHKCEASEHENKFYFTPGSATGAWNALETNIPLPMWGVSSFYSRHSVH